MRVLSETDYVALGRTLLHGDALPKHLVEVVESFVDKTPSQWIRAGDSGERPGVLAFFEPLCMWYRVAEQIKEGRLKPDAPEVQTMESALRTVTAIILPHIVRALAAGHAEALSQLAAVIDAAQAVARSKKSVDIRRARSQMLRVLGLKGQKIHKRTERLQTLLPLWFLGMGRLPYLTQCKILGRIGFGETEIPEDDALRKMLSYYHVPQVAKRLSGGTRRRGGAKKT
jgi:hypothetical protein